MRVISEIWPVRFRLCAGLLAYCATGCVHHVEAPGDLHHITIYSLSWGRHAPLSMTPRRIIEAGDALRTTVSDAGLLRDVGAHVREIASARPLERDHIDGRIVCLLHRTDARIDTLTFGRFFMACNEGYYPTDTTLLRLIGGRLPEGGRQQTEQVIEGSRTRMNEGLPPR